VGWLRYEYLNRARDMRKLLNRTMPNLNFELMTTDGRLYHDGDRDPIMWNDGHAYIVEHAEAAVDM
jgi:hypothetical protein